VTQYALKCFTPYGMRALQFDVIVCLTKPLHHHVILLHLLTALLFTDDTPALKCCSDQTTLVACKRIAICCCFLLCLLHCSPSLHQVTALLCAGDIPCSVLLQ